MGILLRGLAAAGGIRVVAADTTSVIREAVTRQNASNTAGAAIGRTMTAAVLLSHVLLKSPRDRVTVRLSGDGPLGSVTADAGLDHTVRGFALNPELELPLRPDGKLDVGGAVGRDGDVHVIRSHAPYGDPYSATVALTSGEVGEDIATYLAVSEQIPSAVMLGVHFAPEGVVDVAGGVILQALPDADPAALTLLEANIKALGALTSAMQRAPLAEVVEQEICWGLDYELLTKPPLDVRFECRCSDQSALEALAYFSPLEREQMIAEDGGAEVVCHWCGQRRWLDAAAIATLTGAETRCPTCGTLWYREGRTRVYRDGELCSCGRPVTLGN